MAITGSGNGYGLSLGIVNNGDDGSIGLLNNSSLLGNLNGSKSIVADFLAILLSGSAYAILLSLVTVRNYPNSFAFALSLQHVVPVQADVAITGSGNGYGLSLGIVNNGDNGGIGLLRLCAALNGDVASALVYLT